MKSEPNLATSSRDEKFCIAILKSCAILKSRKDVEPLSDPLFFCPPLPFVFSWRNFMARYTKKPVDPSNLGTDPNSYTYVDGYGFTPPPPVITERRMLQFYANGLGFAVLFYFLLSGFVPFLLLRLFALAWPVIRVYGNQVIASSSVILMANLLSSVICLTIPFFVFVLLCRVPLRTAFPLRRFSPGFGALSCCVALGVSVIGLASSSLLTSLLESVNLDPHTSIAIPQKPALLALTALQLCVVSPLVEEFVFRGMIFQSMRRFGDSFALTISAILFALFHGNLVQAPNAFVMGLLIGYMVLYSGSLWVGVLIHAVNNLFNLLLNLLLAVLPEHLQPLFLLMQLALYLIVGIGALLVLVHQYPNIFTFRRSTTFSTERIKYRVCFSSLTLTLAIALLVIMIIQNML